MAMSVYIDGKLLNALQSNRTSFTLVEVNFRNEMVKFVAKRAVRSCFPVNIDVHTSVADSNSPVKYLDARSANQFRAPRLRHVKWYKDMVPVEPSQVLENEQQPNTAAEEKPRRTAPTKTVRDRFNS